jgi:hypothetical protein
LLTGGAVIATICASAFITPAVATAATGGTTPSPAAAAKPAIRALPKAGIPGLTVRTVNLHSQFERELASGHVRTSRTAYSRLAAATGKATPATAAASCTEPNCPLTNHGGTAQHSPKVYLLLWGPGWNTNDTTAPDYVVASYLLGMYYGLGQTSYDHWSTITSQYGATFTKSVLTKALIDTSAPPATVTDSDIASEVAASAGSANFNITDPDNSQVVVAFESGTCFNDGFAGSCGVQQNSGYCAWHNALLATSGPAYLPYTNLPWQLDQPACGAGFVNGSNGGLDGWSIAGGHEYAETVTDPKPDTGWVDTTDKVSGGEIADKCVYLGKDPFGNVTLPIGTQNGKVVTAPFAMQGLWSNANGRCVITSAPALTVTNPGTQKSVLGATVSLQIHAPTNTHVATAFKATGLPPGLSISATTGKITGKPSVSAGPFTVTVTASDYAKTASATFAWQVTSTAGQVKGPGAKCLDDAAAKTTSGNHIDLWTCLTQSRQSVTFNYAGELAVVGKCVTLASGTGLTLQTCTGATSQVWRRTGSGEYVLKSDAKCLTAPKTTSGTQLTIATCANASSQLWSLP